MGETMSEDRITPRMSSEGAGALLIDVAGRHFDEGRQRRLWATAEGLRGLAGVEETVPGMNNLMVVFDPLAVAPEEVERAALEAWHRAPDQGTGEGRVVEVPVAYGGAGGPDLAEFAAAKGLAPDEVVALHRAPLYMVAAVGAMPGFAYLSGLDPRLAMPRRAVPRMGVPTGSVIIGGAQAGIMPLTAPSGWHILGVTDLVLFDPLRPQPSTLRPGDRIRFVPRSIAL